MSKIRDKSGIGKPVRVIALVVLSLLMLMNQCGSMNDTGMLLASSNSRSDKPDQEAGKPTLDVDCNQSDSINPIQRYMENARVDEATPPKRFCPCCGWSSDAEDAAFAGMKTSGLGKVIPDRQCPKCGSLERHRKFCGMMACSGGTSKDADAAAARANSLPLERVHPTVPFRLVHFGPNKAMQDVIEQFSPSIDQVGVDFFAKGYKYDATRVLHGDVTNLQFPAGFANGIIILHVLEHIAKLDTAFAELKRILHPQHGWLFVEVPCAATSKPTKDCRTWLKDNKRTEGLEECSGQRDHVWSFNCADFVKKITDAGFDCEEWYQLNSQEQCLSEAWRKSILPTNKAEKIPSLFCRPKSVSL